MENQQSQEAQENQSQLQQETQASQQAEQIKRQILLKIEESIPNQIKSNFKRTYSINPFDFNNFSKNLTQLTNSNSDIRQHLFNNEQNLLDISGDILANTLQRYWKVGDDIYNIYLQNAKQ